MAEEKSFLSQWNASVERYGSYFRMLAQTNRDDIFAMLQNVFTSWKGFTQLSAWYNKTESIALRQQLGEISSDEVRELNSVVGDGVTFFRSRSEPAKIQAYS